MKKVSSSTIAIVFVLIISIGFVSAGFFQDVFDFFKPTELGPVGYCETTSDCGEPVDQLVCAENNIMRLQENPVCVVNRCSAFDSSCKTNYCSSSPSSTFVETCEFGCLDGACVSDPVCGNNLMEEGEECDDGNTLNGDGCSIFCTIEIPPTVCGNNIMESGEECDDGNILNGDGCSSFCTIENTLPTGETVALFSGTKIYLGDRLNKVKSTLTKSNLPTVLSDGNFIGNINTAHTQKITLGSHPRVTFAKQPTGDEDPLVGLSLSTSTTNLIYAMTITFDQSVNFTHASSIGREIHLFGNNYFVSTRTVGNKLVLLKEANKLFLSVGGNNPNPSEVVIINNQEYLVELIGATDFSATIKITGPTGNVDVIEIDEASHSIIQGFEVAVLTADESQAIGVISASLLVGSQVLTLTAGSEVMVGSSDIAIDNTNVGIIGGVTATTRIAIEVAAQEDDEDSINVGGFFVDPVFGSFKIEFPELSIASSSPFREDISIRNSGSSQMVVAFKDYSGNLLNNFRWVYNETDASGGGMQLSNGKEGIIHVVENELMNKSEYVVIGNENNGGLFKITTLTNSITEFELTMTDMFTGATSTVTDPTGSGTGIITLKGQDYTYNFVDATTSAARQIRLNYPESTGNDMILFPTIETSKGANFAFYEPVIINIDDWDGKGNNVSNFKFPDGEGYTNIPSSTGGDITVGELTYKIEDMAGGEVMISLNDLSGNKIDRPAIVIIEEKDGNNRYEAIIVELDAGYDGDNAGIGISDVERTWSSDSQWDNIQLESDSDIYQEIDFWGTLITLDKSDSDQTTTTISYPDNQIYAKLYVSSLLDDPISCTTDADCPSETEIFCNEAGSACSSTTFFLCVEGICSVGGGGGGCSLPCENGCFEGECLPGPIPTTCENSCEFNNGCIPYGIRQSFNESSYYCDIDKVIKEQLLNNDVCDNDYECVSNVCTDGECLPLRETLETQTNFLRTIFCWITNPINKEGRGQCLVG